jgi:hypothetical protein
MKMQTFKKVVKLITAHATTRYDVSCLELISGEQERDGMAIGRG